VLEIILLELSLDVDKLKFVQDVKLVNVTVLCNCQIVAKLGSLERVLVR